jgi:hypothetical protein
MSETLTDDHHDWATEFCGIDTRAQSQSGGSDQPGAQTAPAAPADAGGGGLLSSLGNVVSAAGSTINSAVDTVKETASGAIDAATGAIPTVANDSAPLTNAAAPNASPGGGADPSAQQPVNATSSSELVPLVIDIDVSP